MKFLFVDRNQNMTTEWLEKLRESDFENIKVHRGDFFGFKTDCVVSPANSYGFMDGGLDYAISLRFGWDLQKRVRERIIDEFNGELLVGQSFIIETKDNEIPYLLVAPTMRVPEFVPSSPNAYLAMRSAMLTLKKNTYPINTITFSGFCTGVGAMPFDVCAEQMIKAYHDFWLGEFTPPVSWLDAKNRHLRLTGWKRNE